MELLTSGLIHWLSAAVLAVTTPVAIGNGGGNPELHPLGGSDVPVVVHVASGREFAGVLDARTSSTELWLRSIGPGLEILRPIAMDRIVSADIAGHSVTGDQLRSLVTQVRREIPAVPVDLMPKTSLVMIGNPRLIEPIPQTSIPTPEPRRVVCLEIEARAGRWDENVEPDGLVVHVYPLDADGVVVPVRGTLNVDLQAERQDQHRLHEPFLDAGHWTESVSSDDFARGPATYRLRFQGVHPEFVPPESNRRVAWRGVVHARLSVPGQGTFEASDDSAILRPHSSPRNHYEAITRHGDFPGYRYFAGERTDDGRR